MPKVNSEEDYYQTYKNRAEKAGRSLELARMTMKHERRLLRMKEKGIEIK